MWQPIETAPRDESDILVFVPDPHHHLDDPPGRMHVACWSSYLMGEERGWVLDVDIDEGRCVFVGNEPTHWRPLPAPPKEA